MPSPKQTKVKVYLRTRPTENFASDMIEFGPDQKVLLSFIIKYTNTKRIAIKLYEIFVKDGEYIQPKTASKPKLREQSSN